ncbi:MAG TPA: hypothetical protein VLW45_10665 [Pelomicrobium sp.]|nr:hypothetical protein [Pelomicrobium sp.]
MPDVLSAFPDRVRGPAGAPPYRRLDGWYALLGIAVDDAPPRAEFTLEGGRVAVARGAPPHPLPAGAQAVAVYAAGDAGEPCVPTGRALLRFAAGEHAADHRRVIEAAGCVLVDTLAYAPEAAWVTAARGDVAETLRLLDALAAIPRVAAVEPQMLQRRAKR